MSNAKLKEYIQAQIDKGKEAPTIRNKLLSAGWDLHAVDSALDECTASSDLSSAESPDVPPSAAPSIPPPFATSSISQIPAKHSEAPPEDSPSEGISMSGHRYIKRKVKEDVNVVVIGDDGESAIAQEEVEKEELIVQEQERIKNAQLAELAKKKRLEEERFAREEKARTEKERAERNERTRQLVIKTVFRVGLLLLLIFGTMQTFLRSQYIDWSKLSRHLVSHPEDPKNTNTASPKQESNGNR